MSTFWFVITTGLVLDTYLYWIHVFMHKYMPRIHGYHHRHYWYRFHWVEYILLWILPLSIFSAMGHPVAATIGGIVFLYEVRMAHRSDYKTVFNPSKGHKLIFRILRPILTNAHYHKKHHDDPRVNYAQFLTLWDRIMKTRKVEFKMQPSGGEMVHYPLEG